MKKRPTQRAAVAALIILTFTSMRGLAVAGPFEPDENTLLLAHFEQDPQQADFAIGMSRFSGNGGCSHAVKGFYRFQPGIIGFG